ncbi:putative disease resistance protein RPP1 [Cinnamomum micranthum f. kanehirae]|uniref:Putative disease resistance protein RPP1 n=1 Tax=Cinnamomum micranthum f. kanehirae TaxID=337451 RepID=A0A3S3QQC2_9MAGN|nr:putative disease resistance protein RPP1 [Cinnamomum micranthum f. kanehirae]
MAMQRFLPTRFMTSRLWEMASPAQAQACDVFINHRGADTKRTVAGLLYDRLVHLNLRPFLDSMSMEPGDKLFPSLDWAIRNCKVGVAIFSPRYCESRFCLQELALLVEAKKKVIPIFCDVQPSELLKMNNISAAAPPEEVERFRRALEEARYTVGIVFDSQNGNWSDLLSEASDIIAKSLND